MHSFSLITYILWLLPIALQTAIAFVMLRRKLLGTFPLFFAYTTVVLSRDVVLLFFRHTINVYFPVYWYGEVLTVLLGLGVIVETLKRLFPPYPFLRVVLKLVWNLGAFAALAAVLLLVLSQVSTGFDRTYELILLAERSARFIQTCWLILVIAFVSYFGWNWQQYSVGVAAGFGIYSALALAVFELRTDLHVLNDHTCALLSSAAYNLGAIVWAFYFLRSPRRPPVVHLPKANSSKANLYAWNNVLTEIYTLQWYRRY